MPEMRFTVRWPDDTVTDCYSPSLVIREHMDVGDSYPVADFVARSREALNIASERVRAKYGFACSSALDQLRRIEEMAVPYAGDGTARVAVLKFTPDE